MRISDFVMGRGDTPYVEIVPRLGNANGARVKMMRPRRVYVGNDLERLFADYLTELARRADELGLPLTADDPLLVNLARPPLLGALREGTVRDKVAALRRKGIGPPGWTPHWLRHSLCHRGCKWAELHRDASFDKISERFLPATSSFVADHGLGS